jgi:hypothetical protein
MLDKILLIVYTKMESSLYTWIGVNRSEKQVGGNKEIQEHNAGTIGCGA